MSRLGSTPSSRFSKCSVTVVVDKRTKMRSKLSSASAIPGILLSYQTTTLLNLIISVTIRENSILSTCSCSHNLVLCHLCMCDTN